MINRDVLKRTLALAGGGPEMRELVVSLNGGYGGTKKKQAMDDLSHIFSELEQALAKQQPENNSH